MQQLFNLEDLAGRTIERAGRTDDALLLFFTDKTFTVVVDVGWDIKDVTIQEEPFNLEPNEYNFSELHQLGIITDEQRDAIASSAEESRQARIRDEEMKKLAELKAKYEG